MQILPLGTEDATNRKGLTPLKQDERKTKKQKEDQALNRVLWWFGSAVVLEFFLLILNRYYIGFDADGIAAAHGFAVFLRVLAVVSLVCAVAGGAWWLKRRKAKGSTLAAGGCCVVSAAVCVCAVLAVVWPSVGVQLMYLAVPAVAVLALIFYLYQREFFLVAVEGAAALLAMWGYRRFIHSTPVGAYVLCGVVAAVTLALLGVTELARRNGGKVHEISLFGKQTVGLPLIYAGGGITLAAVAVALIGGATAAYVALFAVVAWLFAVAVFYTVRLM